MELFRVFYLKSFHRVQKKFFRVFLLIFFHFVDMRFVRILLLNRFLIKLYPLCGHDGLSKNFIIKLFLVRGHGTSTSYLVKHFQFVDMICCLIQEF